MKKIALFRLSIFICCFAAASHAQTNDERKLALPQAVQIALENYPAIRAAQAAAQAADNNVALARVAVQPKIDLLWQQNIGSRNNVFGVLLPQSIIPAIPGPALGTKSFASAMGSTVGALVTWEPLDFGQRNAQVEAARAAANQAQTQIAVTRLEIAATAADAYLAALATEQTMRAAQANVERMEIFAKAVHVLVDNQLRPGADASRTDAELAAARNQFIQAEQMAALARATLAEAIGQAGTTLVLETAQLLVMPPNPAATALTNAATDVAQHPFVAAQQSALAAIKARQFVLDRSYYPKFSWQSALFARGSGADVNGSLRYTRGFYPDTANWATGISISFSPSEIFGLRARKKIENYHYQAEQARYDQTVQKIKAQDARAKIMLDAAQKFAANAPLQLQAAQDTELRIRARYQAELATVTEVAEAQRLLAQSESENALAKLSVWRALLAQAKANGDLTPFLEMIK